MKATISIFDTKLQKIHLMLISFLVSVTFFVKEREVTDSKEGKKKTQSEYF